MSNSNDIWQIMVDGQIYEADTNTLKQWAADKRLLPTDKVKKGSLNWNDAGRIPLLRPVFSGEEIPPPSVEDVPTEPINPSQNSLPNYPPNNGAGYGGFMPTNAMPPAMPQMAPMMSAPMMGTACLNHPDQPIAYVCRMCQASFCQSCPKKVGSMAICLSCGDMCNKVDSIINQAMAQNRIAQDIGQPTNFGWADFSRALAYPLKHPMAFFGAAAVYGFFLLAKQISYGMSSMLISSIASTVFLFACTSTALRKVAIGRINSSFAPEFSASSFYDDVVVPLFLSLGVMLVTFLPVILVFGMFFSQLTGLIMSGAMLSQAEKMQMESNKPVKLTDDDMKHLINSDNPEKDEETMRKLQRGYPTQNLGVKPDPKRTPAPSPGYSLFPSGVIEAFIAKALMTFILLLLAFGWALFYYPMALAIAGFTQDFWAVINPMFGLSTIRTMGMVYVKAWFMYLGAQIGWFAMVMGLLMVAGGLTAIPIFGTIIINVISGIFAFYFSLVVACVFGLALYKSADKLEIVVDPMEEA